MSKELGEGLGALFDGWKFEDALVILLLILSSLVVLYAITLIHRKLRFLEGELAGMRKEQTVMSEELEIVVSMAKDRVSK